MKRALTRRIGMLVVFALALSAGFAFAAGAQLVWHDEIIGARNGLVVMPNSLRAQAVSTALTANRVSRMLGASSVIDFASATITTVDSSAITVTGAQVGDPCFVGPPAAVVVNASFTCIVTAADTVKVRFTPAGTAADPLSGTYFVRVISSQ